MIANTYQTLCEVSRFIEQSGIADTSLINELFEAREYEVAIVIVAHLLMQAPLETLHHSPGIVRIVDDLIREAGLRNSKSKEADAANSTITRWDRWKQSLRPSLP